MTQTSSGCIAPCLGCCHNGSTSSLGFCRFDTRGVRKAPVTVGTLQVTFDVLDEAAINNPLKQFRHFIQAYKGPICGGRFRKASRILEQKQKLHLPSLGKASRLKLLNNCWTVSAAGPLRHLRPKLTRDLNYAGHFDSSLELYYGGNRQLDCVTFLDFPALYSDSTIDLYVESLGAYSLMARCTVFFFSL